MNPADRQIDSNGQNSRSPGHMHGGIPAYGILALLMLGPFASAFAEDGGDPHQTEAADHWAFQPIVQPTVPSTEQRNRIRTPVDAFILSRLDELGLQFSQPATRGELIRRAKFDLLGLPPTPEEIHRFESDSRPGAYERLIDEFLASPHFGETWGRQWLDLVRFAETAGFNADPIRPLAWKYRDYVVDAFNKDTPYDRFVREQLAGDELYPDQLAAIVATGLLRMWPDESNASDVLLARQDALNDLTSNVGAVFLGLSIGCAQCHDHKFDPIPQSDFYELQAYLVGIVPVDRVSVATHDRLQEFREQQETWRRQTEALMGELHALESAARAKVGRVKRLKFPAIVLEAIDTQLDKRTPMQHQLVFWSERQIVTKEDQLKKAMTAEQNRRRQELKQQLADWNKKQPRPLQQASLMATIEVSSTPPPTFLLAGGSYQAPLDEVRPNVPRALRRDSFAAPGITSPRAGTSGRRSALARWMTASGNPLTARVMANRLWRGHFGRGLVADANDFGTHAAPPTHPQLLDWLAAEFQRRGWSQKQMHRLIMLSGVYRQSTDRRPGDRSLTAAERKDPDNKLYWNFPRRRLSAERIRDSLLAVSGQLNPAMHGPGVHPQLPANFSSREKWKVSKNRSDRDRRSVYIFAKRNLPYPLLQAFDFPDMHESCAQRPETVIAPQALMMLNSKLFLQAAERFAERVREEAASDEEQDLIHRAWWLAFGRDPSGQEIKAAATFLGQQSDSLRADRKRPVSEQQPASEKPSSQGRNRRVQQQALVDLCHVLLNANEFLYLE